MRISHKVILSGGSTRIPYIQHMLRGYFGKEALRSVNPEDVNAYGAALLASILTGEEPMGCSFGPITALTLGVESKGGVFASIIPRHSITPTIHRKMSVPERIIST